MDVLKQFIKNSILKYWYTGIAFTLNVFEVAKNNVFSKNEN